MAVEINTIVEEVVVDDSKAVSGAQRVVGALQSMETAANKAADAVKRPASGLEQLEQLGARLGPAQRSAQGAFERWGAVANQNERAFNQMVRAENEMFRAIQQGHGSQEQMVRILDEMWKKSIGAADAAEQHAIALEKQRQAADAAQAAFNRQLGVGSGSGAGSAAASAGVFQEQAAAAAQAQALLEKHDILAAATRRYGEAVAQADAFLAQNIYSAEQHQRVLAGERAALEQATIASQRLAGGWRLQGWQARQLTLQINDVIQSLALGMPVQQVFLQQGFQIAQLWDMSAASLLRFGIPLAAVAVTLGTVAAAFIKGQNEAAAFNRAIQLTGNAAGVTAGELDAMVNSAAEMSNIGASAARAIATSMVASGKIGEEVIGRLLEMNEDYAAATGQSSREAGEALQKLFVDPAKGAKELDDAYNLLTDSQRQHIQTLTEQGRRSEAQLALTDALNERTKNMAQDGLGWLERGWNAAAAAASNYWDKAKGIGRPETLEDQIARLKERLQFLNSLGGSTGLPFAKDSGDIQNELEALLTKKFAQDALAAADERNAKLREETKILGDVTRGYGDTASKQLELTNQSIRFQAAIDGIREKLAGMRDDGGAQGPLAELLRDLTLLEQGAADTALALGALRTPLQESQAQTSIARQVSALTPAQRGPREAFLSALDSARHGTPEQARDAEAIAAQAFTRALIAQNQAINDNIALTNLNIEGAKAVGAAYLESGEAALRAAAARQAATRAFQTGVDAEAETQRILNDQAAKGYEDGARQLKQLQEQADAQERIAAAARGGEAEQHAAELAAQIERATRSILELAAVADPELAARLQALAEGIGSAMTRDDEADRLTKINQAIRGQEQSLELIRAEQELVGATNDEHDIAIALLQAKVDLQRMGVDAASAEGQAYIQNAENIARANNELRQSRRERQEIDNFYDDVIDKSGEFAANIAKGKQEFQDWAEVGEEVLNEMIDLFVELSLNQLKNNMALGGDTGRPTLGSVGQMFGLGGDPTGGTSLKGTVADPVYVTVTNGGFGGPGGGMPSGTPGFPGMPGGAGAPGGGSTVPGTGFSDAGYANAANTGYVAPGAAGAGGSWMGAGIGAGIGGTAGYFLGDAIGGKTGGTIGAIAGALLGAFIGFGFENGGIMTSRGPVGLRRYEFGGIARGPEMAIFGEGRMPEAYVPLPDGRTIPVTMRGGMESGRAGNDNAGRRSGNRYSVTNNFNIPPSPNGFGRSGRQLAAMGAELTVRSLRNLG